MGITRCQSAETGTAEARVRESLLLPPTEVSILRMWLQASSIHFCITKELCLGPWQESMTFHNNHSDLEWFTTCCLEKHTPRVGLGAFWTDIVWGLHPRKGLSASVDPSPETPSGVWGGGLKPQALSGVPVFADIFWREEGDRNWYIYGKAENKMLTLTIY